MYVKMTLYYAALLYLVVRFMAHNSFWNYMFVNEYLVMDSSNL